MPPPTSAKHPLIAPMFSIASQHLKPPNTMINHDARLPIQPYPKAKYDDATDNTHLATPPMPSKPRWDPGIKPTYSYTALSRKLPRPKSPSRLISPALWNRPHINPGARTPHIHSLRTLADHLPRPPNRFTAVKEKGVHPKLTSI